MNSFKSVIAVSLFILAQVLIVLGVYEIYHGIVNASGLPRQTASALAAGVDRFVAFGPLYAGIFMISIGAMMEFLMYKIFLEWKAANKAG